MTIAQTLSNSSKASKGVIVIADHDAASLKIISAAFEKVGWRVSFAHNGDEVLSISDNANVDAILLDMRMPSLGDCKICTQLLDLGRKIPTMLIGGCIGNAELPGSVNLGNTTIRFITAEELADFSATASNRFVWRGEIQPRATCNSRDTQPGPVWMEDNNHEQPGIFQPA